ncbi:PREDICTED: uncharacterized protein LOC105560402 isoform X1 [Vollenhovia emeryi]|uniref:uncharacterized protein LOC105560402 isoform X1 n=1 Tax=Vollenhovia emeryi TaxID=411798 RepID=UPI0005F5071A|nr:PREDICTED: uncharacterized protein LOC105560402 isoform X1 [Vollenhovia emeryi]
MVPLDDEVKKAAIWAIFSVNSQIRLFQHITQLISSHIPSKFKSERSSRWLLYVWLLQNQEWRERERLGRCGWCYTGERYRWSFRRMLCRKSEITLKRNICIVNSNRKDSNAFISIPHAHFCTARN